MLTMRIPLLVIALLFAGNIVAQSQEPLPTPSKDGKDQKTHPNATNENPASNPTGTDKQPFVVKSLEAEKTPERTEQERPEREEKAANEGRLVSWTIVLSVATMVLAVIAGGQLVAFGLQARRLRENVEEMKIATKETEKTANAAIVASMPVLSPHIVLVGNTPIHPLILPHGNPTDQPIIFDAHVDFVFENFGKTPGIIRELRADLFLNERDAFPVVEFSELPIIDYQPIIAGDSRGENAMMGVAECTKERVTLTLVEFAELLSPYSRPGKYRRFALIGRMIYDDFFDNRHIRRFCIKLRLLDRDIFQLERGGKAYNHIERQAIPKDE